MLRLQSGRSVNMHLLFKMPTARVITAGSLLIPLLLFQLINMDTDGIKQNITQISLQPPGLLNLNGFVNPKITQGSFTKTTSLARSIHTYISISVSIRICMCLSVCTCCRSENLSLSFTAAVATRIHPASIIQQRKQLPLEVI